MKTPFTVLKEVLALRFLEPSMLIEEPVGEFDEVLKPLLDTTSLSLYATLKILSEVDPRDRGQGFYQGETAIAGLLHSQLTAEYGQYVDEDTYSLKLRWHEQRWVIVKYNRQQHLQTTKQRLGMP